MLVSMHANVLSKNVERFMLSYFLILRRLLGFAAVAFACLLLASRTRRRGAAAAADGGVDVT